MAPPVYAEGPVSIEVRVLPPNPFVHQSVAIEVRVHADTSKLVQLYAQELDLPIQIQADWLHSAAGRTLVLNDGAVEAGQTSPGVYVLRQRITPDKPGELKLDDIRLRYATAESFREDFIHGPVPVGRIDVERMIPVPPLQVRALPTAPSGFSGAVGVFTIEAECNVHAVDLGAPFYLTLRIRGPENPENLDQFEAPRLDSMANFHVYGATDVIADGVRTFRYEIAVTDPAVNGVPAIEFTSFDPASAKYRVVATQPIELTIRAGTPDQNEDEDEWFPALWVALAGGLIGVAAGLLRRRRLARKHTEFSAATVAFREREGADALATYPALRMGCEPASVIGPDLAQRLRDFGLPTELAERTAEAMKAAVGAGYGGAQPVGRADELVIELDRAFARLLG